MIHDLQWKETTDAPRCEKLLYSDQVSWFRLSAEMHGRENPLTGRLVNQYREREPKMLVGGRGERLEPPRL